MTSVIIRKIETPLQRMVNGRGGIKVRDALDAAQSNLQSLEEICLQELDARLGPVHALLERSPSERPSDEDLALVIRYADAALTACGALNNPMLGRSLIMFCALADALRQTRYWPSGALTPAINLITLTRARHIADDAAEALLGELHRCLLSYLEHAA